MPSEYEMPNNRFKTVIRYIKRVQIDRVVGLRAATHAELKRMGVRRDLEKAVKGMPKASDHLNVADIIQWMRRIPGRSDVTEQAVNQVVAIDATAVARCNG